MGDWLKSLTIGVNVSVRFGTEEPFGPGALGSLPWRFPPRATLRLTSTRVRATMASEKAKLDIEVCHERAAECHQLASATKSPPLQIMLDHIAESWMRIARDLVG